MGGAHTLAAPAAVATPSGTKRMAYDIIIISDDESGSSSSVIRKRSCPDTPSPRTREADQEDCEAIPEDNSEIVTDDEIELPSVLQTQVRSLSFMPSHIPIIS